MRVIHPIPRASGRAPEAPGGSGASASLAGFCGDADTTSNAADQGLLCPLRSAAGELERVGAGPVVLALLDETGLRLGEALCLQHFEWHSGQGEYPFIEVGPRAHPHGARVKGGIYRKIYIFGELYRSSRWRSYSIAASGWPCRW